MALTPAQIQQQIEEAYKKSMLEGLETCSVPWVANYHINLPNLPINLQQLFTILAAVACIVNTILALHLLWGHLFHWVRPSEQRQIVRIIMFVPFFSICQLWAIWFYGAAGSLIPVAQLYEGYAVTALFLLYVNMVAPDTSTRARSFHQLERKLYNGKVRNTGRGSLRWFRIIWFLVFQLTIFRILYVVGNAIITSIYCPLDKMRAILLEITSVVSGVSATLAVTAIVVFEVRMRPYMEEHKSTFKLFSFKGVVGLEILQGIIFPVLAEKSVFTPSPPFHISYLDFSTGMPTFILIWAITIAVIMFQWSFSFKAYRAEVLRGTPIIANAGRAFVSSFNPFDIYWGLFIAFRGFKVEEDYTGDAVRLEAVAEAPAPRLDRGTSYSGYKKVEPWDYTQDVASDASRDQSRS